MAKELPDYAHNHVAPTGLGCYDVPDSIRSSEKTEGRVPRKGNPRQDGSLRNLEIWIFGRFEALATIENLVTFPGYIVEEWRTTAPTDGPADASLRCPAAMSPASYQ
ncbi:MAG: hypothetical protein M1836_007145 [Candelina mexicana]|nr:MAG: hypothetical protein M1836_007145 [Candelina mexicana]